MYLDDQMSDRGPRHSNRHRNGSSQFHQRAGNLLAHLLSDLSNQPRMVRKAGMASRDKTGSEKFLVGQRN